MLRDLCLALASVRSEARWTKQDGANQSVSLVLVVMRVFAGPGLCVCASFSGALLRASEPIGFAVHLQYVDMISQAVEHIIQSNVNKISYNRCIAPTMGKAPREVHLKNIMQVASLSRREEKLRRLDHGISTEEEQSAEARFTEVRNDMEATLTKNTCLTGASFSLADISMAPFIERFEANKLDRLVDRSVRRDWRLVVAAEGAAIIRYRLFGQESQRGVNICHSRST